MATFAPNATATVNPTINNINNNTTTTSLRSQTRPMGITSAQCLLNGGRRKQAKPQRKTVELETMGTPTPSQVGDAVVDSGVDSEVSPSSPESNHNERLSSVISDSIMETAETLLALKSSGKTTTSHSPSSSPANNSDHPLPVTTLPLLSLPTPQNPPILSSHQVVVPSAKCVVDEASKIQEYLRRGDTAVVFPQHPDPISQHEKGSEDSPESDSYGYEDESPEFALLCPKCSKPYHSINSLRDHLKDEHQIDPSDLPDVLMGISTVGKEPNGSGDLVDCKVCQKQFANVYRLQRHMISHDESVGLRRFKCNDCGKAFKFKHHLKEHIRIHTGDKPFECKHCGKRFSHSGSYSSHMTSKKCQNNKAKSNSSGSQDHSLNDMECQSVGPVTTAKDIQLQTEALVSSLTTPLALSTCVNTITTASVSSVSPSTSTTSNTSSSTVIQLPTEPAPMLSTTTTTTTATAFNPLFLNPFMLTSQLAKPELMNPMKALLPDLSLISPLNSLSKPHIADTLANMFGKEELDNLRRMLETVNATVTRSLLEDNLKKWSQEILTNNAILDQLSKAQPIPPESNNGDSDYPMSDGDDDGTEESANKRSRVRTQISDEQASILRGCYMVNPKPKREELQQIADRIGHPFKVVKVWFQNTRARDRREGRTTSTPTKPITPFDVTLNNLPISLKNLSPLPPNVVFSKFPTPPASMTEFQPSPTASPRPPKAETPLDLSTKRSTPCETPPPLVINSDPEDSEDEENDDEEGDENEDQQDERMESDESDDEDSNSNTQNGDSNNSGPPQTQDLLNNAKKQFEKMIQDKLVSLSPSAASIVLPTKPVEILPTKPLPDENLVPVNGIYSCDQCDKTFTKKSSITRHKYEHSDQRPHKCMDCDKAFKHKHHLTEHKRLHSGEKPFQCPKCLKRFSHSGSYSQHINHRFSYCKPIKDAN